MTSDVANATSSRWDHSRIVISSDAARPLLPLFELWAYREVLYALVWREMKVRYAQTVAGAGWVILQPLLTTGVLSVLAGRWMKVPSGDLAYPLFAYSGLVPWMYFTHVLTKSSVSLMATGLLSKAYFPRLLLPLGSAVGGLIDLLVAGAMLACLMVVYGVMPSAAILLLPAALLLAVIVSFGMGVWLSVLNLYHRDIAHALPFTTQILFFITPVAYPLSVVPQDWRLVYSLNPMAAVIQCWRSAVLAEPLEMSVPQFALSLSAAGVLVVTGLWYFSRMEPTLADVGET